MTAGRSGLGWPRVVYVDIAGTSAQEVKNDYRSVGWPLGSTVPMIRGGRNSGSGRHRRPDSELGPVSAGQDETLDGGGQGSTAVTALLRVGPANGGTPEVRPGQPERTRDGELDGGEDYDMRGTDTSRPGLGWPAAIPDRKRLAAAGSWQADVPGGGLRPAGGATQASDPASVRKTGGLGWPVSQAGGSGFAELNLAGGLRSASSAVAATEHVSRETEDRDGHPSFESPAGTVVASPEYQRDGSGWADDLDQPASTEQPARTTEPAPSTPHQDAAGPAETSAGPGRPAHPTERLAVDTWRAPSVDIGRPSEYRDGSMIAGSYSGAEGARAESEDQVAIPSAPDRSADTPIARAAQAAMNARASNAPWPRPRSCRILTIANQKGGVGKTTTAVNLAASLAMHGSRVLVVDLDPQGNASTALDVDHRSGTQSIYNVLVDGRPLAEVIRPVEGFPLLQCAPATIDLAGAEIELVPLVAREARLSRAVAEYDASNLDYVFIDCPPSLGLLTVNALVAAPEVLIPIQCEYYALEGLEQLLRTVDLVRNHLNPGLKVSTILLTMFDSRTRLATQVADEVRSHFGEMVLGSIIPRSVRVSEAPSYGQSVMTYDPGSSGAQAYLEAAREMAFKSAPPV